MQYQQTESHSDDEMSDKKPKARDTKRQQATKQTDKYDSDETESDAELNLKPLYSSYKKVESRNFI